MGTDRTPTTGAIAALALPVRYTITGPTESNLRADRDQYTGTTRARIDMVGSRTPIGNNEASTSIEMRAQINPETSAGAWAWRRDEAGSWLGADRPTVVAYQGAVFWEPLTGTLDDALSVSVITLPNSPTRVAAWMYTTTGNDVRLAVGTKTSVAWSATSSSNGPTLMSIANASGDLAGGAGCCLILQDDGSVMLYGIYSDTQGATWTLAAWRSEDPTDGVSSWILQSTDVLGVTWTSDPPRLVRGDLTDTGATILFVSRHTSTSTRATQYQSADGLSFTAVSAVDTLAIAVWDARRVRGVMRVLWEINDSGTPKIGSSVAVTDSAIVPAVADTFHSISDGWIAGAAVAVDPYAPGRWYAIVFDDTTKIYRSASTGDISGSSDAWALTPADGTGTIGQGSATWHGDALVVIGSRRTASDLSNCVTEIRLGGGSDLTLTRWWSTVPTWLGLCSLDLSAGWGISDIGGGVTRSHAYDTGEYVTADGVSQGRYQSSDEGTCDRVLMLAYVIPDTGTTRMRLQHTSDGANVYAIHVDLTATSIVMYDATGAAGATTAITTSGAAVALSIWLQGSTARCWYAIGIGTYPQQWSELTLSGITTAAGTTSIGRIGCEASSSCHIRRVAFTSGDQTPTYPTPGAVADVAGIPLSSGEYRYVGDAFSARVIGAPVRRDSVSHVMDLRGERPYENVDPYTASSPRDVWRGPSNVTQTFTLSPPNTDDRYIHPVWLIYLAGLRNVPRVTIQGGGLPATLLDLRTTLVYQGMGRTVRPASTGATVTGQWVGHDQLVGSQFRLADGNVRAIIGNTAGSLTSGSTVSQLRAIIELDGAADTSGTGYIYPYAACIASCEVTLADPSDRLAGPWTISIASTEPADSGAVREVGVIAVGPAYLCGIAPDRTIAREAAPGSEEVELPDGRRYAVDRRPAERRVEFSWVASPHDSRGTVGPGTQSQGSPDYVKGATGGGPAGMHEPVELIASAVAAHGRHPAILAYIPAASSAWVDGGAVGDWTVIGPVPWQQGVHYVTIQGTPRLEQVPTLDAEMMQRLAVLAGREVV